MFAAVNTQQQPAPVFSSPAASVASAPVVAPKQGQQQAENAASKEPSLKEVKQAVESVNQQLGGASEKVTFGYEAKLNRLYVQVTDKSSGEVIREIPSKDFIKHQLAMREMIGLILDKTA